MQNVETQYQQMFLTVRFRSGRLPIVWVLWKQKLYFDKVLAMGHWVAPYICQRVTSAVKYMHCKVGLFLLNYADDFLGAEHRDITQMAFDRLGEILQQINLVENENKAVPPTPIIEFLGVTFNSETGTMEVSPHRLQELQQLLDVWLCKSCYTRKQLESLIGKLIFVAVCVRPGRIFICRLLNSLCNTPQV